MNTPAKLLIASILAATSFCASATTTPTYDTFGKLAGATFGGAGISNDHVAIDTFKGNNWLGQSTGNLITLGLTITPRYGNYAVSNNGAGVFTVDTGIDKTSPSSTLEQLAKWNLGYYVGGAVSSNLYTYKLLVDIDPSSKDNFKTLYLYGNEQDSINLGATVYETIGGYTFDPTKKGEYSIVLEALNTLTGAMVGHTSIVIDVKSAVPEQETYGMLLAGLGVLGFATRRRKA